VRSLPATALARAARRTRGSRPDDAAGHGPGTALGICP